MYGIPGSVKPLSAAEEQVMLAVWACRAPVTRRDIDAKLRAKGWAPATVLNFLYRLEEKGCVNREKPGRGDLYTATLTRSEYLPAESKSVWHRLFGGSPRSFVAALAETDTLTDADIDELAKYLEELKKERK